MRLKDQVKPITYLKNHTAEMVHQISENGRSVVITQNGEAKVVVVDVETYDRWQEALAWLKLLSPFGDGCPDGPGLVAAAGFPEGQGGPEEGQAK